MRNTQKTRFGLFVLSLLLGGMLYGRTEQTKQKTAKPVTMIKENSGVPSWKKKLSFDKHFFTDEKIKGMLKKNKLSKDLLKANLPYIYPTVLKPIGMSLGQYPIKEIEHQKLAKYGILDVTQPPFNADSTGTNDSTQAIQQAVYYARDHQLACYFPAGTYLISDTINCSINLYLRANNKIQGARDYPCVLLGSTANSENRTTFVLAPHSKGFGTPEKRKIFIHFWSRPTLKKLMLKGADMQQANINYNQIFYNIDIKIGKNNPGAVGIRMQAAEGSSIQDSTIDATHGFSGMQGAAGSGGSHHNITVIGGRIGIDTHGFPPEFALTRTGTQPTPTMSHVTLINQTECAFVNYSRGPFIAVGWKIVTNKPGPVILNSRGNKPTSLNSSVCFVDSEIIYKNSSSENNVILSDRSFYFNNVFIKNATKIQNEKANPNGWIQVKHLAVPINQVIKGHKITEPVYLDGKRSNKPFFRFAMNKKTPTNLRSKHIWEKDFPSWQSKGAVNVKDAPYNAKGDSYNDDTDAIQRAIDENEIIFLPKGLFRVSKTLKLKPDTKLIGLAQNLSIIMVRDEDGNFADAENPVPIVETSNTSNASTVIAFLGIFVFAETLNLDHPNDTLHHFALKWQSGGDSIFRTNQIDYHRQQEFIPHKNFKDLSVVHPLIQVTNNGGGKWYNLWIHWRHKQQKQYRHLLIKDTETPISFYQLHAQHAPSDMQVEIRNSKNIDIFGAKTEYETSFMSIYDSSKIRIFGHGGVAKADKGSSHYSFYNVKDFLFSNFNDQPVWGPTIIKKRWNGRKWYWWNFKEYYPYIFISKDGKKTIIPPTERPILYMLGTP